MTYRARRINNQLEVAKSLDESCRPKGCRISHRWRGRGCLSLPGARRDDGAGEDGRRDRAIDRGGEEARRGDSAAGDLMGGGPMGRRSDGPRSGPCAKCVQPWSPDERARVVGALEKRPAAGGTRRFPTAWADAKAICGRCAITGGSRGGRHGSCRHNRLPGHGTAEALPNRTPCLRRLLYLSSWICQIPWAASRSARTVCSLPW
jgi:hypothetical protein